MIKRKLTAKQFPLPSLSDAAVALIKNSSKLVGAQGIVLLVSVIQSVLIARFLRVDGYGEFVLVFSSVGTVRLLVDSRVEEMGVKYLTESLVTGDMERARATTKLVAMVETGAALLGFVSVMLLADSLASVVGIPGRESLIRLFAITILLGGLNGMGSTILRATDRYSLLAASRVARSVSQLIGVVCLAKMGVVGMIWAAILASTVNAGIMLTSSIVAIRPLLGLRDIVSAKLSVLRDEKRNIRKFIFSSYLNTTFGAFVKEADSLFLGAVTSASDVGYYKMAKSIAGLLGLVTLPVYQAAFSSFVRELRLGSRRSVVRFSKEVSRFMAIIIVPATLVLVLLAPFLVRIGPGTSFLPAVHGIWILAPALGMSGLLVWVRPALLSMNVVVAPTVVNGIIAVFHVLAILAWVPYSGYRGAAGILAADYLVGHIGLVVIFFWALRHQTSSTH